MTAKRILAGIALVALILLVHTLHYHEIKFEEANQLAELGRGAAPGCKPMPMVSFMVADLSDCFNVMDDGTWIRRRGY